MIRILWTQKQDEGPSPRAFPAMAYDSGRGRTVLFGGSSIIEAGTLSGDTWEWDGANWTQMADSGPSPRTQSVMAYDAQRAQTVLFSGLGVVEGQDTWGWDGNNWTQLADSGPPQRVLAAMAYDSKRQRSLLFGGGASEAYGDTWAWDGAAWTQLAEAGPPPRYAPSMGYDTSRDRSVLFGGEAGIGGTTFGDTWEWDVAAWTQISSFGAPPCGGAALAFKGDSVALLGGKKPFFSTNPGGLGITWTWDGQHWTLRQDFGPPPRYGHAMTYDTKRACLTVFGGTNSDVSFGDTWEHSEG
jgi:hypothetical protein